MGENIHEGHRERLKKRYLEYGLESFSDIEAIELLLFFAIPRRSTNELAHLLLDRFHSFRGVMEANLSDLESVSGIGENAALLLSLVTAMSGRYHARGSERGTAIRSSADAGRYLLPLFKYRTEESSFLLCLDASGRVIGHHLLENGTPTMVGISARDMADIVLRDKAARVILAHNHVSDTALPSGADVETTSHVFSMMQMLGVELVDHIIVCENDYVSMRDSGFFANL